MSSEKKIRKDKEIFLELEGQIKDLKHQLNEQLRCLDQRLESQVCMSWELQDFFQRRAEVEIEYSKNLEKLVKQTMARHKAEKQKREQWQVYSAYKMWQTLLGITLKQSKIHGILSETYNAAIVAKFTQQMEDMQRIYKKCREMAVVVHDEITKVVTELHSSMKTYHVYHNESQQAELKYEKAEKEKNRFEQESKKGSQSRRFKNFEKQFMKHKIKFEESDLKALKARNDYLLCLDSANGAIRKFFVDDLPELINVMDYSYHVSLGQVMMSVGDMEEAINRIKSESLVLLSQKARELNQRSDRQAFLQQFHQIFSLPKKLEFQAHKGDKVCEVSVPFAVREEMADRLKTITDRLHKLKLEDDEVWKTLETTDTALLEKRSLRDFDPMSLFRCEKDQTTAEPQQQQPRASFDHSADKQNKTERVETEEFYLGKFREHQLNSNLIARLQAKAATIEKALGSSKPTSEGSTSSPPKRPLSLAFRQTKKRHLGKSSLASQPKLFGGSIEEYVQTTGQEIPALVRCCIRIINLFGMHHQGVFRVPGSQHEINEFRELFERGEEPVLSNIDSRDINSIAGVLKLYFRELREPLFPLQLFDELMACSSKYNISDMSELKKCISRIQELVLPLPRPILVVMRYLFSFLNHLSEYSDENMMDAHNLAVCFGPTLMPIQSDHDQMRCQNYINELIRILIIHQEAIFPKDGGPVYEKCIVEDDGEESLDIMLDDIVGEDEFESQETTALHDYTGQSERELTFRKGEVFNLISRISTDWWEGTASNRTGLIPHKYINFGGRGNVDKESTNSDEKLKMSSESLPASQFAELTSHRPTAAEPLDRSISQPNICGGLQPRSSATLPSFSSASSDGLRGSPFNSCSESLQSISSKDCLDSDARTGSRSSNERLMSVGSDILPGSSFLEMEPTPDLVLNLPFNISQDSAADQGSLTPLPPPPSPATINPSLAQPDPPVPSTSVSSSTRAAVEHGVVKQGASSGSGQRLEDLPSPQIDVLKPGMSPDVVNADEMFNSALEEIEQTLSGLVVASSLKLFGINPKKSPVAPSAAFSTLFPPSRETGAQSASGAASVSTDESGSDAKQPADSSDKKHAESESKPSSSLHVEPKRLSAAESTDVQQPSASSLEDLDTKAPKPAIDDKPKPRPPPTMKKPFGSTVKEKPSA